MMRFSRSIVAPMLGAALLAFPSTAQSVQTLPSGFDTVEGSSSTAYPFSSTATHKWHWAYDSGQFNATFPILITQIDIRPNGGVASWPAVTYDNLTVRLGASQNDYQFATYDPTFDNNWAAGTGSPHNFYAGNLAVPAGTGGATPNPWSISIVGTPFLYDPTQGNDFIVELRTPGSGSGNPTLHTTDGQSGTAGANGGNRYGSITDANAATWTFNNNEFVPIVRIHYTPASGLYPGFSATPTSGASPLTVQFTDQTFTSDPNGITGWAWDFDNDGNVDSTLQSPSYTYNAGGKYSVALTVTDNLHGSRTELKTNYIDVDPIYPDFTATPTFGAAPLTVQFTDTTVGNPIAWNWDFDNDGNVDSTVQNPSYTYTSGGTYTVALSVTNGVNLDSITKTDLITVVGATNNTQSPAILEFQFNEPRGTTVANTASTTTAPSHGTLAADGWQGDPGRTFWMGNDAGSGCLGADNVTPYNSNVDTNWAVDITGSHTISFWTRPQATVGTSYQFGMVGGGSGRCYYTSSLSGGFSLRSWGPTSITDAGTSPNAVTGWNHWAVVIDDQAGTVQWYLNGAIDGTQTTFTPGTFTYTPGGNFAIGTYSTLTSSSSYSRYADIDDFRIYGRALTPGQILQAMLFENPTTSTFGSGCAGAAGIPQIGASGGAPTVAGNVAFSLEAANMEPGRPAAINLGLMQASNPFLPYDLTVVGPSLAGCFAEVFPDQVAFGVSNVTGSASVPFRVPADPSLATFHFYCQLVVLGTTGAVSPALDINFK